MAGAGEYGDRKIQEAAAGPEHEQLLECQGAAFLPHPLVDESAQENKKNTNFRQEQVTSFPFLLPSALTRIFAAFTAEHESVLRSLTCSRHVRESLRGQGGRRGVLSVSKNIDDTLVRG